MKYSTSALMSILFLLFGSILFGQKNSDKAKELGLEAIQLIDAGKFDESIVLLEKAKKLDPKSMMYPYEIALAHYFKEDYALAIEILTSLTHHKKVENVVYQLLGNAYDMIGKPEIALATYKEGMLKFPESGVFYMESGVVKFKQADYDEALRLYEEGIKVEPNYSSNYYRLSNLFSMTDEKIWTLLYGEYLILLEPSTQRTQETSQLLYDTYQKIYVAKTDSSGEFNLTKKGINLVVDNKVDVSHSQKPILPFELTFATAFTFSALHFQDKINIASIYKA